DVALNLVNYFFFSSRRRHTRWPRDWSSDVCSSDLVPNNTVHLTGAQASSALKLLEALEDHDDVQNVSANLDVDPAELEKLSAARSEERRVGKSVGRAGGRTRRKEKR